MRPEPIVWSASEECDPLFGRNSALKTETPKCESLLADAMRQLNARDGDCRVLETLEAEHHGDAPLDAPMVVLNQIVQVFWTCFGKVESS